jgi:hypothetical protein
VSIKAKKMGALRDSKHISLFNRTDPKIISALVIATADDYIRANLLRPDGSLPDELVDILSPEQQAKLVISKHSDIWIVLFVILVFAGGATFAIFVSNLIKRTKNKDK